MKGSCAYRRFDVDGQDKILFLEIDCSIFRARGIVSTLNDCKKKTKGYDGGKSRIILIWMRECVASSQQFSIKDIEGACLQQIWPGWSE